MSHRHHLQRRTRNRHPKKGASTQEYALILALMGGTAVGMVYNFGQIFLQSFEGSNTVYANAMAYAFSDGVGVLTLANTPPPQGTLGTPYLWQAAGTLAQEGFLDDGSPIWQASNLPPGLSLDSTTGALSGTPTATGTFQTTIAVARGEAQASRTFGIVIAP